MAERHVTELLSELFRRGGMVRAVRRAEAVVAWPRVVGADLARFAQARTLKNGVLFVDVPDSETAMHLSLQRSRILDAYERELGGREVREVRFVAGRPVPVETAAPDMREHEPDPNEWSALTRELAPLDLPPELAGAALDAARAMLRHRQRARVAGWTPCPDCGALTAEAGSCAACTRTRASLAVQRLADRLMVDPTAAAPNRTEAERQLARAVAVERLDERIAEVLPQVVTSPALRPQLERAATIRVALAEDRAPADVDDDDLQRYDPRVARVLGRWGSRGSEGGSST